MAKDSVHAVDRHHRNINDNVVDRGDGRSPRWQTGRWDLTEVGYATSQNLLPFGCGTVERRLCGNGQEIGAAKRDVEQFSRAGLQQKIGCAHRCRGVAILNDQASRDGLSNCGIIQGDRDISAASELAIIDDRIVGAITVAIDLADQRIAIGVARSPVERH
ncbi:unannotated protein [freshwater metagenome]|uniref:Unannotated protein n=1 Tax=freshwater metagenome TaxID=449393 RepID=A0A6J6CB23_9ZZZZ